MPEQPNNITNSEVRIERMRPEQIRACRQRWDIAFLPLGALEWHGLHNPIGTDALKAHYICCTAARKLGGGAVFPAIVWGVPRDSFYVGTSSTFGEISEPVAAAFGADVARLRGTTQHGGMDVQEQWLFYQRLLRMSLEQIAGFGFRSIYVCTGHNPLIHWARPVAVTFTRATQMTGHPVTVECGGEFDAANLSGDHGGKWETSLMMAADPALVDLDSIMHRPRDEIVGADADAVEATREQGKRWVEACAAAMADKARIMVERFPQLP